MGDRLGGDWSGRRKEEGDLWLYTDVCKKNKKLLNSKNYCKKRIVQSLNSIKSSVRLVKF